MHADMATCRHASCQESMKESMKNWVAKGVDNTFWTLQNTVLLFSYTNCTSCIQSKALRERWLLDGAPSAGPEHDDVKRQLEQDEAKTKSLEDTITRWGTQMSGPLPVSIPVSESSCVLLVQAGGGASPAGGWRHSPAHNTHCSEYTHTHTHINKQSPLVTYHRCLSPDSLGCQALLFWLN